MYPVVLYVLMGGIAITLLYLLFNKTDATRLRTWFRKTRGDDCGVRSWQWRNRLVAPDDPLKAQPQQDW